MNFNFRDYNRNSQKDLKIDLSYFTFDRSNGDTSRCHTYHWVYNESLDSFIFLPFLNRLEFYKINFEKNKFEFLFDLKPQDLKISKRKLDTEEAWEKVLNKKFKNVEDFEELIGPKIVKIQLGKL